MTPKRVENPVATWLLHFGGEAFKRERLKLLLSWLEAFAKVMDGSAYGIRTRDLRLERAMS
jgi:hypothetical protein